MAKKNKEDLDQIPLSETQNTAVTGRKDERDALTITVDGKRVSDTFKKLLLGDAEEQQGRPYRITEASLKDGLCKYAYEITRGTGVGDTHNVKGSALYEDDMGRAFAKFNQHLAFVDDAFKLSGIEVTDIDLLANHELTMLYTTTGFKIKGDKDSEAITLIGHKYVSLGGRMEIETLKIALDSHSSYKWYNELNAAADAAREEVALYKEGKCIVPDTEEEEKPDPRQSKLPFGEGDARNHVSEDDFAEAAL